MAPFRNLLGRKPAPPTGADDRGDEEKSRTSTDGRPGPLSIRKSNDSSTNEYKLSGMLLSAEFFMVENTLRLLHDRPQSLTATVFIFLYLSPSF